MSLLKTTIYSSQSRAQVSLFTSLYQISLNIWNFRELILQLFRRDFLASYKKSFLGIAWVVISPVFGIAAWVLTNKTGILNPGETIVPYPAYVLVGTFVWSLFIGFYTSAVATLAVGAGFIQQVKYPHEVLFAKQIVQQFFSSSIVFCVNILTLIAFGVMPSWKIIFLPFIIIPLIMLSSAIGLIVSVLSVVVQDVQKVFDVSWNFIFWLTPVIYTANISDSFLKVINDYNPLTYLVCGARDLILVGNIGTLTGFLYSSFLSVFIFIIALRFFYVSEEKVIEKIL